MNAPWEERDRLILDGILDDLPEEHPLRVQAELAEREAELKLDGLDSEARRCRGALLLVCPACGARSLRVEPPTPTGLRFGWCAECGHEQEGIPTLPAYEWDAFLRVEIPERRHLLHPVLRERDLGMIHGWRGLGKSWLAAGVAYAVASGVPVLGWRPDEPAGVLLVDGEMPARDLQERLGEIAAGAESPPLAPFRVLAADLAPDGIPSLATETGQAALEEHLEGIKLLVLDNLSSLYRTAAAENDAESWRTMQDWLLSLRRRGLAVLVVHHSGKGGAQRGTSSREDVLSLVLGLHAPKSPGRNGAHFELHFEKARGLRAGEADNLDVRLRPGDHGGVVLAYKTMERSVSDQAVALLADGLSQAEVARELGCNRSTVSRAARQHSLTQHNEAEK